MGSTKLIKIGKYLWVFALIFCAAIKHPFYLSVVDLKYHPQEKQFQGSIKIFVNDLEAALKKTHQKTIDLMQATDEVATKALLADYLKTHFYINVNNTSCPLKCIGYEREEEALWMYVQIPCGTTPKQIRIENNILYDHVKEQMNIVHLDVLGEKKSYKVSYPEKEMLFEF